jgi:hypothetical protein
MDSGLNKRSGKDGPSNSTDTSLKRAILLPCNLAAVIQATTREFLTHLHTRARGGTRKGLPESFPNVFTRAREKRQEKRIPFGPNRICERDHARQTATRRGTPRSHKLTARKCLVCVARPG